MQDLRSRLQLLVFLGCMSPLAQAALNCGAESNVTYAVDVGPRHHPVGKPLPPGTQFNQPTHCSDGAWFFDLNHNARPDPGEPRLYGHQRVLGCSSCHAASPDAKTDASASVFLRQDARVLCLICHRL